MPIESPHLAFGDIAQPLVLLHAILGLALCGATTHHVVVAIGYRRGVYRWRLGQIYALVTASCYAAAFTLGMLVYPSYRYFVRGLYLDHHVVWASNLFDIKENFAALGLPLVFSVLLLSRKFRPAEHRELVTPYLALVSAVWFLTWFPALAGLIVTLQRGVPA